jgi:hypothetical protein
VPEIEIVRASLDHVPTIAARMRQADRDEVWAASRFLPADALIFSITNSTHAFTVLIDGRPEAAFGVGILSAVTGLGAPWLLATDEILTIRRDFLRRSVVWRDAFLTICPTLRAVIDDRNAVSKRWLRWLGATFSDPFPVGREQIPFRAFELRADHV